jgi:CRP/FNR family transcriptional regulator
MGTYNTYVSITLLHPCPGTMISSNDLDQLLAYYPSLHELPARLCQSLQLHAQAVSAPAGRILFDVSETCHVFLTITAGSVRVVRPGNAGHEIMLYHIRPGGACIFTISCLLGDIAYPARGIVEKNLSGFTIPQPLFLEMVNQSVAFRTHIFRLLADRITHLMNLIEAVTFGTLDQRLAALLLAKATPVVKTTHQTLADELGSNRETVSRVLEAFEERGLINLGRGQILILDIAALHKVARFIA